MIKSYLLDRICNLCQKQAATTSQCLRCSMAVCRHLMNPKTHVCLNCERTKAVAA